MVVMRLGTRPQTAVGSGSWRRTKSGFDGNERVDCDNCGGAGTIEFVIPDMTGIETVAAVEEFLNPTITVDHPNMTPAFFDDAVRRAHDAGLTIEFANDKETALVSSASNPAVRYLTTRTTCSCTGGTTHGRCLHRARLIAELDVFGTPVAEPIAA